MSTMAMLCRINIFKPSMKNSIAVAITPIVNQKRTLYGKEMRKIMNIPPRKKPFPYLEKHLYLWRLLLDPTSERLSANSKVICVEGPIASGKTEVAKQIAEEFDMKHFPEPTMDMIYINRYGYDLRKLDPQLPESCKSYDHVNFCKNPSHPTSSSYQIDMYMLRFGQYVDALAHLFNTGQGVVLERSPFSDFVFIEAMLQSQFISKTARSVYMDVRQNTITDLLSPHLVLYLDVPVNVIQQRVKERNYPHEQNSPVMSTEYLSAMEKIYKTRYLKEIDKSSQLLVYDWSSWGDNEILFEDIERLDLDTYELHSKRFKDWQFIDEHDLGDARRLFTIFKTHLMANFSVPRFDCPEMVISPEENLIMWNVYENAPGEKYAYGFNKNCGDTGLLFKTEKYHRGVIHEDVK